MRRRQTFVELTRFRRCGSTLREKRGTCLARRWLFTRPRARLTRVPSGAAAIVGDEEAVQAMKKSMSIAFVAVAIGLAAAGPSHARGGGGGHGSGGHTSGHFGGHRGFPRQRHGLVFLGGGPVFYGPYWDPYWWDYPPNVIPPAVVVPEPPVYLQRPPQAYWYYCPSARAYYPTVQSCGDAWIAVPPRAP